MLAENRDDGLICSIMDVLVCCHSVDIKCSGYIVEFPSICEP